MSESQSGSNTSPYIQMNLFSYPRLALEVSVRRTAKTDGTNRWEQTFLTGRKKHKNPPKEKQGYQFTGLILNRGGGAASETNEQGSHFNGGFCVKLNKFMPNKLRKTPTILLKRTSSDHRPPHINGESRAFICSVCEKGTL